MRIIFLCVMIVFYSVFLIKALVLRQKGITVFVMFGNKFKDKTQAVTLLSGLIVIALALTAVVFDLGMHNILTLKIFGAVVSVIGTIFFLKAVSDMKSSWRVGVNHGEKTALIVDGIYAISRNPAYVGFDLLYIGITVAYFNLPLLIFTVIYIFSLNHQIRIEEKFLSVSFGEEYNDYISKTKRYLGRKR